MLLAADVGSGMGRELHQEQKNNPKTKGKKQQNSAKTVENQRKNKRKRQRNRKKNNPKFIPQGTEKKQTNTA